jgi:hypothetical protein
MNERIKELAEQAGFDAVSMVAFDIGQDLEKFAELLWKEAYEEGYNKGLSDAHDEQAGV